MLRDKNGKFAKGNKGFWLDKKRPNISGEKNCRWSGGLVEKTCLSCGNKFNFGVKKRKKTARFCSHSCRARWYFTGERNPRWRGGLPREQRTELPEYNKWRSVVYRRDDWECRICGYKGRKIIAHHLRVWKNFPEERFNIENGITLCRGCHCRLHTTHKDIIDFKVILRDYTLDSERR